MIASEEDRLFYGWAIVAYTFVIQFLVMGSTFYIFGVLLKPLSEALDADRFLISLGLSAQMVVGALIGPWLGGAVAKYSIRHLMRAGIVLLGLGLLTVSQATELWHFYTGFALITSTGFALAGPLPNAALIANWFNRQRGTAMGASQFGITFSGVILVPLFTWIMVNHDWRTALVVFAVGVPAVGLPIIWYGIVKTPEEKNLHPDGDEQSGYFPHTSIIQEGRENTVGPPGRNPALFGPSLSGPFVLFRALRRRSGRTRRRPRVLRNCIEGRLGWRLPARRAPSPPRRCRWGRR